MVWGMLPLVFMSTYDVDIILFILEYIIKIV
jgi:hypothetical protein